MIQNWFWGFLVALILILMVNFRKIQRILIDQSSCCQWSSNQIPNNRLMQDVVNMIEKYIWWIFIKFIRKVNPHQKVCFIYFTQLSILCLACLSTLPIIFGCRIISTLEEFSFIIENSLLFNLILFFIVFINYAKRRHFGFYMITNWNPIEILIEY